MKILVTGAAGFLGSHLVARLVNNGHEVIGIDDLSTGMIENVKNHPRFKFIKHDVRDFDVPAVDFIYNLASPASPIHYQSNPVKTFETNILGIIRMLQAAKDQKIKIIQASTSEVYGDPLVSPQVESYWGNVNPIGLRACYDEGKRASETISFDYLRQFGVDVRIVRIFNTYGPNMAIGDGRVVSNFIVQALNNQEITVYGNGDQTRSLCFASDLIEALICIMELKENPKTPINVGNPNEIKVIDLARKIVFLTQSNSVISHQKLPEDDPQQRKPDISLAKKLLHWEPKINLDDGLRLTVDYFKQELSK
jgi:UDP-glucuronate decarboxylase